MPEPTQAPAAPVFVTLRTAQGRLRGCIGTLRATQQDVRQEAARNALLAACEDPRFAPLAEEELEGLRVEVSVLFPEEPVRSVQELDPQRFGVVVRDGAGRRGLLLPAVDGVDDAQTQLRIAREKAGIGPLEAVTLHRFEARKFS